MSGLLQSEFSGKLDINASTLSDIENSKHLPRIEFLLKLASVFNVNMNYILAGKGEPFIKKENELEIFLKEEPFGDSTGDVKDILESMKKSPLFFRAIMFYAKEYFIKNKRHILKNFSEYEEKKNKKK